MTFGYFRAVVLTKEVVVHKGLKGVEVGVTGVPLPLASVLVGSKVFSTPIVCQTAEPKEMPIHIKRYDI